jgi:hypothetical protein
MQDAFAFVGSPLPERKQAAETAVSGTVRRIDEQARRIFEIEARTDDKPKRTTVLLILGRDVGAHDACERVAIGYRDGRKAEFLRLFDEFFRVGSASQKRKIARDLKLGVEPRHSPNPYANNPCKNHEGGPLPSSLS